MQRLMYLKLLSKAPKTPSNASLLLSPKTPSHHSHQFFTHYANFSHSKNGIITQQGLFSNGFFPKSILAKHFFTNILSNCQKNGIFGAHFGSVKALFSRRSFHSLNSYGRGWRSGSQWLTSDGVIWALILSNAAVFMLWRVADRSFMIKNFMISGDNLKSGHIHTLITHAFSHMDISHLLSNMIGLYFFGNSVRFRQIGRNFGPKYLLKLYLAGAVVGAVFHLVYSAMTPSIRGSSAKALGASGAVNAIMLLEIFLFPRRTIYLDFFIPLPAFVLGILIIGKDVWRIMQGDSQISGAGHLGGASVAAVAWALARRGIH